MYKLGALLLRDANVSLSEDEQIERLQQFADDAYSVEYQLARVCSCHFNRVLLKLNLANKPTKTYQIYFEW